MYLKWPNIFQKVLQYADKQLKWKGLLDFSGKVETGKKITALRVEILID